MFKASSPKIAIDTLFASLVVQASLGTRSS